VVSIYTEPPQGIPATMTTVTTISRSGASGSHPHTEKHATRTTLHYRVVTRHGRTPRRPAVETFTRMRSLICITKDIVNWQLIRKVKN